MKLTSNFTLTPLRQIKSYLQIHTHNKYLKSTNTTDTWWTWKPCLPGGISPLISPRKVSFPSSFCCKWMEPFKAPFSSQCASSSLVDKRMKIEIKKEKRLPAVDDRQEARHRHHHRRHQHLSQDDLERNHCFLSDRLLLSTLGYATHGQQPTLVSGLQRATVGSGKSALDFRGELLFSSPRSYRAQPGGHSHPWSNTSTQKPCTPNTAYTKHSFQMSWTLSQIPLCVIACSTHSSGRPPVSYPVIPFAFTFLFWEFFTFHI